MAGQASACPAYQVWFAPKVWFPPALIPVHTLRGSASSSIKEKSLQDQPAILHLKS
jgi:hypothetical protein